MNVGRRRSARWQEIHLRDPRAVTPASRMPSYAHLFAGDGTRGVALVAYLGSLGAGTPALAAPLPTTVIAPPHARAQGKRLFGELCAPCHGAGGRGDGPLAASLADPRVNLRDRDATGRDIQEIVRHGVPGTSMPGHEYLADDEIAALAAYVRAVLER
jgi:cytochrome c oxidase cbb3-type subunit 2